MKKYRYEWDIEERLTERDLEIRNQISHMLVNGFRINDMKSKLRQLG